MINSVDVLDRIRKIENNNKETQNRNEEKIETIPNEIIEESKKEVNNKFIIILLIIITVILIITIVIVNSNMKKHDEIRKEVKRKYKLEKKKEDKNKIVINSKNEPKLGPDIFGDIEVLS